MTPLTLAAAFSVDAESFVAFARSLPGAIGRRDGEVLRPEDVTDFDLCWAYEFADPWGNCFELNCYDHEAVRRDLIDIDGIHPDRKWPADLYDAWRRRT